MTYRVHNYTYKSVLGQERNYILELPGNLSPRVYKTMTAHMRWWHGEVLDVAHGRAVAAVGTGAHAGKAIGDLKPGRPCYVMEHLNLDGVLEIWICSDNIYQGNDNYINFGVPGGKHLRIDIYNGDFRIIE